METEKVANNSDKELILKAQAASHDPTHNKYWRIDDLPDDLRELVIDLLKRHSPRTVAEVIRDAGYHLDIAPITLQHYLETYRRDRIDLSECINPYMVEKLTSELKKKVNCFSAMSDLIIMQQERIRVARMGELDGELVPEVNKQVHLLTRMLKVYSDMGMKAGLMHTFVHQYENECQEEEDSFTIEIERVYRQVVSTLASNYPRVLKTLLGSKTKHSHIDTD